MGTTCIRGRIFCPTLKGLEMGIFGFPQKETGAKSVAMATRCHSLPFVMHISGAKFEEHCSNISGDIFE